MHPEISALVAMLEEASTLFEDHEINHWAEWLEKDARLIRNSDFYGIEHLLSAYGGMGSLNDVALMIKNPNNPNALLPSPDDPRLQELISAIYSSALKLSREEIAARSGHKV